MAAELERDYCNILLKHVSRDIKELQAEQCDLTSYAGEVTVRNRKANALCEHLDMVLRHQLLSPSMGYWKYVTQFTRSEVIKEIKQLPKIKTDLGRGRAWLFTALNEQSLEAYFRNFQENRNLMLKFYKFGALLRDKEQLVLLQTLLCGLEYIVFNLSLDFEYLDMATCDPSTSTKIRKSFNTLEETPAQYVSDHQPPIPTIAESSQVLSSSSGETTSLDTPTEVREETPPTPQPVVAQTTTVKVQEKNSSNLEEAPSESSSKESSLTRSHLVRGPNAVMELTMESGYFSNEISPLTAGSKDLDEFNVVSLRARPKEKKGAGKKTKKPHSKGPHHQTSRVVSQEVEKSPKEPTSSTPSASEESSPVRSQEIEKMADTSPKSEVKVSSPEGRTKQTDIIDHAKRFDDQSEEHNATEHSTVLIQPVSQSVHHESASQDEKTLDRQTESSLENVLFDKNKLEIPKDSTPSSRIGALELSKSSLQKHPPREQTKDIDERSPSDAKSPKQSPLDVLSFGVPERPLTVGEEDKFATEVVISQKNKLLISLNVCFDSSETLQKLLQVFQFSGKALLQVCYLLITNDALYILENSEGEAGYSRITGCRLKDLDDTQVGLNWQSLTFVFGHPQQYHMIVTCDEALTRGIVECLTEMTVKHPKIRQPIGMSKGDRLRWKALQQILPVQDESDVELYSIAYWEQLEGDMPPPCTSPPPELEESCESGPPLIQGTLQIKSNKFGVPFWKPSFLVLRTDALLQYNSETDMSVKLKYPLQSNNFGGCKRLPKESRPNCFMVSEAYSVL
jgi:hypothetical protein